MTARVKGVAIGEPWRPAVDLATARKAWPKAGTEYGNATMGWCALPTCQGRIVRSDPFVVTLAGDLFHCRCWQQVRCRDLSKTG